RSQTPRFVDARQRELVLGEKKNAEHKDNKMTHIITNNSKHKAHTNPHNSNHKKDHNPIDTPQNNPHERRVNHFAVVVPQPFRAIDKLAVRESPEVRTYTSLTLASFVVRSAPLKRPRTGGNFRDGMCNCNAVPRDTITIAMWS
ncbi:hypothetical protein, partial [Escherichia coli]|uniref:hypothetical protein n=1 Tax=Escherichia coli TaxID=562 RepID=UPI00397C5CA7